MKLSLAQLGKKGEGEEEAVSYAQEADIFEPLDLKLEMPDGTTKVMKFTTGDTIQIIKKRLEAEHDIPFTSVDCLLDGKVMLEPLSLNDFPNLDKSNPTIQVRKRE
ncbi:hypothetical protein QOT17_015839 [Balamuthia mandrillaris]